MLFAAVAIFGASASPASAESSLENPPPGANDFSCKPSPAHPRPVVLVHGLGANMSDNWSYISPILARQGYCVFAFTYGLDPRFDGPQQVGGVIPIEQSAPELKPFVEKVLAATGAPQVDLVGHSEGTVMPQYWLKFLGGAPLVKRYVAMTPLYDGTQLAGLDFFRDLAGGFGLDGAVTGSVAQVCGSCPQFLRNSELMQKLREGGPAVPSVSYTTIPTKYDELVNPWQSGLLDAPNATNMVLQDVCPNDTSEHVAEAFDPVVAQIILNSLDPSRAVTPSCSGGAPGYAAGAGLIETDLRGFVKGFKLRRLTLRSLPAGTRVKLSCRESKRSHAGKGNGARRTCSRTRSFTARETSQVRKVGGPFRGKRLRSGSRIRVAITAPDVRGKRFTLKVDRKGKARPKLRCTAPSGGPASC